MQSRDSVLPCSIACWRILLAETKAALTKPCSRIAMKSCGIGNLLAAIC